MNMMTFHWFLWLYYVRYSAGHSYWELHSFILCVCPLSRPLPTPRAYSCTPTYPTVLTIVHSDGTTSYPSTPAYMRAKPALCQFCHQRCHYVVVILSALSSLVVVLLSALQSCRQVAICITTLLRWSGYGGSIHRRHWHYLHPEKLS
jgi:hypothetical protein